LATEGASALNGLPDRISAAIDLKGVRDQGAENGLDSLRAVDLFPTLFRNYSLIVLFDNNYV
jgi:hypothetical protein